LLTHQYADRALLKACDVCAAYCRYCFRKDWILERKGRQTVEAKPAELFRAELAYLAAHPEITELLVSGGDPLMRSDGWLGELFAELRRVRPDMRIRLCTRMATVRPARFTAETFALLERYRPLRIAAHINHSDELTPEARAVFARCIAAGIPVLTQTVLLRGVNDDADALAALFREFAALGLTPYYLFQMDLPRGTAHFRVPLMEGISLYESLQSRFADAPGMLPAYTVDLPGGGGKTRLSRSVIAGEGSDERGEFWQLRGSDGRLWVYPKI
jgi:lysine 2,3-aminomutase